MTPSGYALFLRDETLVLRALSDDANDGFFNIDRVPNTPHAIEHLRQHGMALARQAKVTFTDFTLTTPAPPTKSAPKKPRKLICLSLTRRAVRHRAGNADSLSSPEITHTDCWWALTLFWRAHWNAYQRIWRFKMFRQSPRRRAF